MEVITGEYLDELAYRYGSDKGSRCSTGLQPKDYTLYYSVYFAGVRQDRIKFLEIGVASGASARMWEEYFPNAILYGIDIDLDCKRHESDRTRIFIGDQADENFLHSFIQEVGDDFGVIIDDGGHTMRQQICSFLTLFPHVRPGGIYVIEDLHTSYMPKFGGGYGNKGSTVEFLKGLMDGVIYSPAASDKGEFSFLSGSVASVHFYKSIAFIFKKEDCLEKTDRNRKDEHKSMFTAFIGRAHALANRFRA